MIPIIKLNNNIKIPAMGINCGFKNDDELKNNILLGLETGYRFILTDGTVYDIERLGNILIHSNIPRKDLIICTKLLHTYKDAKDYMYRTLEKLKTDYIDLVYLSQPSRDDYYRYKVLENMVAEGRIKAIGLGNFYEEELEELLNYIEIKPAFIQLEVNLLCQQIFMQQYLKDLDIQIFGIAINAFLGHELKHKSIISIAKKHSKTPFQILLRWLYQRGIFFTFNSSNKNHLIENQQIFDFSLDNDDLELISTLDNPEYEYGYLVDYS